MSYDLMVFDPGAAPANRAEFEAWYDAQIEWGEGHSYDDPANTSPALAAWFFEMTKAFPAMNGPFASDDFDNDKVSDYSVGRAVIYVAFAWSEAAAAYEAVFGTARRHGLGFYDVSGDAGEVWLPAPDGTYACAHRAS